MTNKPPQVFICYTEDDLAAAKRVAADLRRNNINTWLVEDNLEAGQRRHDHIRGAIWESDYFIALLSRASLAAKGDHHAQLKFGLERQSSFPWNKTFVIPMRLDDCDLLYEQLKELQTVDIFVSYERGLDKVLRAITSNVEVHAQTDPESELQLDLFSNCGGILFDISYQSSEQPLPASAALTLPEGQQLVGTVVSIGTDRLGLEIGGNTVVQVPRPEPNLEICIPEEHDRIALQVREGQILIRTMAQIIPINEREYYYGKSVAFSPSHYDIELKVVVGTVDGDVRAYARLTGREGDIVVNALYAHSPEERQQRRIPVAPQPLNLPVLETVYQEGAWALFLSSGLRPNSVINHYPEGDARRKLLQISYMFDYLEHQERLVCQVQRVDSKSTSIIRLNRLATTYGAGLTFHMSLDHSHFDGDTVELQNLAIMREKGHFAFFQQYKNLPPLDPAVSYSAVYLASRGNEHCVSVRLQIAERPVYLPVIIDNIAELDNNSFGFALPPFSFVTLENVAWSAAQNVYRGQVVSATMDSLDNTKLEKGHWLWYLSTAANEGQLWGINPRAGVWIPIYPYNHLLGKMGVPVVNEQVLAYCQKHVADESHFETEKQSIILSSRKGRNHLSFNNGVLSLLVTPQLGGKKGLGRLSLPTGQGVLLEARVTGADDTYLFLETAAGQRGLCLLIDFDNTAQISVGDIIVVFFPEDQRNKEDILFSRSIAIALEQWGHLEAALETSAQIEGKVVKEIHGGYLVEVFGFTGFWGISVGARTKLNKRFEGPIIGRILQFTVQNLNKAKGRVSLNYMPHGPQLTTYDFYEGQVCEGVVDGVLDYGVFVDLGGRNGLLHRNNLSYRRFNHPSELFAVGDTITTIVLSIDHERGWIQLGRKELLPDPWSMAETLFSIGDTVAGIVSDVAAFGVFVDLSEGIIGLLHVSELPVRNLKLAQLQMLFPAGVSISVAVKEVNATQRRLRLTSCEALEQVIHNATTSYGWERAEAQDPGTERIIELSDERGTVQVVVQKLNPNEGVVVIGRDGMTGIIDVETILQDFRTALLRIGDLVDVQKLSDQIGKRVRYELALPPELPSQNVVEQYHVGMEINGEVLCIYYHAGIFVRLHHGLVGLIRLTGAKTIRSALQKNTTSGFIKAVIESVDESTQRIYLAIDSSANVGKQIEAATPPMPAPKRPDLVLPTLPMPQVAMISIPGAIPPANAGSSPHSSDDVEALPERDDARKHVLANIKETSGELYTPPDDVPHTPLAQIHNGPPLPIVRGAGLAQIAPDPAESEAVFQVQVYGIDQNEGLYVTDTMGRVGLISRGIGLNFQAAYAQIGDVITVVDDGKTISGKPRFKLAPSPQTPLLNADDPRYAEGAMFTAKVLGAFYVFGIFVELAPGVVGLVRLSRRKSIQNALQRCSAYGTLDVTVRSVDSSTGQIYLTLTPLQTAAGRAFEHTPPAAPPEARHAGNVAEAAEEGREVPRVPLPKFE